MSRLIALRKRGELRAIHALEARVGVLERDQRRLHVARELKLLARDEQRLLDLGERPFVAAARKLLVERFERDLLALRFRQPRLRARRASPALRCSPPSPDRRGAWLALFSVSASASFRASSCRRASTAVARLIPMPCGEEQRDDRKHEREHACEPNPHTRGGWRLARRCCRRARKAARAVICAGAGEAGVPVSFIAGTVATNAWLCNRAEMRFESSRTMPSSPAFGDEDLIEPELRGRGGDARMRHEHRRALKQRLAFGAPSMA